MSAYLKKYRGQCPFFGAVTGFRYVREADYYEFDRNGSPTRHVDKPFCRGVASVSFE
jgi:hypothetical protein